MAQAGLLGQIPAQVWQTEWNVHGQAVGASSSAVQYLAPYVFKVAITDRRLVKVDNDQVTCRYRQPHSHRERTMTLHALAFIRRFLQHGLLGVLDAWMWTRDPETQGQDQRHAPIEAKESVRWLEGYERVAELAPPRPDTRLVSVADREGDSHAFMVKAQHLGHPADGLIRATHNRCTDSDQKRWDRLEAAPALGEVSFSLPAAPGRLARTVKQTRRVERVTRPPARGAAVAVTALLAREDAPPTGQPPLVGRRLTNRAVNTLEAALEVIEWYRARWSIELFFRLWKPGCRVEALQLSTRERLEPALALDLVIAWRVPLLMLRGRTGPELPCEVVFDPEEWQAASIVGKRQAPPPPATGGDDRPGSRLRGLVGAQTGRTTRSASALDRLAADSGFCHRRAGDVRNT